MGLLEDEQLIRILTGDGGPQHWVDRMITEANRRGDDYSGKGVHVAARIAALASGGEILASTGTAAEASQWCSVSEPRAVELKGVTGDVEVVSVSWN